MSITFKPLRTGGVSYHIQESHLSAQGILSDNEYSVANIFMDEYLFPTSNHGPTSSHLDRVL